MTDVIVFVVLVLIAFFVGIFLGRSNSKKEIIHSSTRISLLNEELNTLRSTLTTKSKEFQDVLADKSNRHANELLKLREEHHSLIRAADEKGFIEGTRLAELRNEKNVDALSVQVKPYVAKVKDEGIFSTKLSSEIGYQYQLLVHGIPCFQPHIVIEQKHAETEINDERLKFLTDKALETAKLAIQSYSSSNLFSVVDSPQIDERNK